MALPLLGGDAVRPDLSVNAVVTMITQRRLAIENERLCIWLEIRVYAYPTNAAPGNWPRLIMGDHTPSAKRASPLAQPKPFNLTNSHLPPKIQIKKLPQPLTTSCVESV